MQSFRRGQKYKLVTHKGFHQANAIFVRNIASMAIVVKIHEYLYPQRYKYQW